MESPWISAEEDEVFLTVISLEVNWAHGGVINKHLFCINDEGKNNSENNLPLIYTQAELVMLNSFNSIYTCMLHSEQSRVWSVDRSGHCPSFPAKIPLFFSNLVPLSSWSVCDSYQSIL